MAKEFLLIYFEVDGGRKSSHLFLGWNGHMNPTPPTSPRPKAIIDIPDMRFSWCCSTTLIVVKSFNVEINVAICFWTGLDRSSDVYSWVAPTVEAAVKTKGHHCHRKEITSSQLGWLWPSLVLLLAWQNRICNLIMW